MYDESELPKCLNALAVDLAEPTPIRLEPPWASTPAFRELQVLLANSGEFTEFESNKLQSLGQGSTAVTLRDLAGWMVRRASTVGGEQAVQEVRDYLACTEFPASTVMLLTGLHFDGEFDLGGGVTLVPLAALPTEHLRTSAFAEWLSGLPLPRPTGALVCEFTQPRRHYSQEDWDEKHEWTMLPSQNLEDARLCLTMSSPEGRGVQRIATGAVAGDDLPMLGGTAWSMHEYVPFQIARSLIAIEADRARAIHEQFLALPAADQARLRVPLLRLNRAAATGDLVERAVALRTALEALFLDDPIQSEISYRLALRAALFTERTPEARKRVRDLVKDLYQVCSAAVHHGELPTKNGKKTKLQPTDLLKCGRKLVFRAIEARLQHPTVNWEEVEHSGGVREDPGEPSTSESAC